MSNFRFTVTPCHSSIVMIVGDAAGEVATLWREGGCPSCQDEGTTMFAQVRVNGETPELSEDNNPLVITLPGTYELRWEGLAPPDARLCVQEYERKCGDA